MKIALFHDLPAGGALKATQEISKKLQKHHDLTTYTLEKLKCYTTLKFSIDPVNRLLNDFCALTKSRKIQKQIAKKINAQDYSAVIVTHTRFFQAPWILRYLKVKTIFLCQEPTRAFFEDFLGVDKSLPVLNKFYEKTIRSIKKKIEIANASFPDQIVANSKFSSLQIQKAYNRKAQTVHLGVNQKDFYLLKCKKRNQVLIVGNNEPQKNLSLAIKAVAQVSSEIRPKLIIVSPRKSNFKDLQKRAKKLGVNLQIKSQIKLSKLRKIYNQSITTLATAKNEPFGLSVLESMACGTPVIAVKQGGFKESIVDGKTGFLTNLSSSEIADKISLLLKNPETQAKMSKQSIEHVRNNFTWEKTITTLEKIFSQV